MSKTKETKPQKAATKKLTATQRIGLIENTVANMQSQYTEQINILADEIDNLRTIIRSLYKRLNASITISQSEDAVKTLLAEQSANDLKNVVDGLVAQGSFKFTDEPTTEDTFLVGRQVKEDGTVLDPRIQFLIRRINKDLRDKLIGKKVGDLVDISLDDAEEKVLLEIMETYLPVVEEEKETEQTV